MKNLKIKTLKIAVVAVAIATTVLSCKKKELDTVYIKQQEINEVEIKTLEKLTRYLAISINVEIKEITYDSIKNEFNVRKGVYIVSRKDIEASYVVANEYKLNYE